MKKFVITKETQSKIPDTSGFPQGLPGVENDIRLNALKPVQCSLEFKEATDLIKDAIEMGVEVYGSGIYCYALPSILKSNGNTNRPAKLWQLIVKEVLGGAYTNQQINKAWHGYTKSQKIELNDLLVDELYQQVDYLLEAYPQA